MHPALVTVNCAYSEKYLLGEDKLAEILKSKKFPETYPEWEQVEVFFSEVPVDLIWDFCKKHGITLEELREYYEKNIKPRFRNEELEELWEW